jgi:hypothetical protein
MAETTFEPFVRNLAAAFLAGPWDSPGLRERGGRACGRRGRWLAPLVRRLLRQYPEPPAGPDAESTVAAFLQADPTSRRACARHAPIGYPLSELFWLPPQMDRTAPGAAWGVPDLPTTGALADWLGVSARRLNSLAELRPGGDDAEAR